MGLRTDGRKPLRSCMPSSGSLTPGLYRRDSSLFQQEVVETDARYQTQLWVLKIKQRTAQIQLLSSGPRHEVLQRSGVCLNL